jgi:transcriptional regulator with XRE-family HTH domain
MKTVWAPREVASREHESNLNDFRLAAGLTIKEICKKADITTGDYVMLNSGKRSPIRMNGVVCDQAAKLASFLNAELSDLFPRYFCSMSLADEIPDDIIAREFHSSMISETPEEIYERKEAAKFILGIVNDLPFDQKISTMRLDRTLDEIAEDLGGKSRERVRQIELNGWNKIKRVIRNSEFNDCLGEE